MKDVGSMGLYAVDVRDRVIQRVSAEYNGADNLRVFLIEADSARQAWAKISRSSTAISSPACESCRHGYCGACEDCSIGKQSSDYWICHRCGELNQRVPNCI
jgi:hypothetical protein